MNKYWVITKEVYKKNIKSFGFIAMVLSPLVLVAVVAGITYYFSQEEQTEPDTQIAVISENETINQIFSSQDWDFQIDDDIKEESEAEEALLDESISGYLTAEVENGTVNAELVYTDDFSDQIKHYSRKFI